MALLRPTHFVVAEILGVHSTTVLDIGRRFGATNAWWLGRHRIETPTTVF